MLQTLINKWSFIAVAVVVICFSGCGDAEPGSSGTLTGTVKSGGEVCGDCGITLFCPDTLLSRGGRVDEAGNFEIKNVPFGEYGVSLTQKPTNDIKVVFDKRIPKKYRNAGTSGLTASLTTAEPVVLNIEM